MNHKVFPFERWLWACALIVVWASGCSPELPRTEDGAVTHPSDITDRGPPPSDEATDSRVPPLEDVIVAQDAPAPDAAREDRPRAEDHPFVTTDIGEFSCQVPGFDAGMAPDADGSCEGPPSAPPSREAFVRDWAEAWAVPVTHTSGESPAVDGLGNTFLLNAEPWTDAPWAPDASFPNDVLASSVDADGNLRWVVRTMGAAPVVYALLPTEDGGFAAAFNCAGAVTATPTGLSCGGPAGASLVIARFDASGTLRWSRALGGRSAQFISPLARDDADNLYFVTRQSEARGEVWSVDARGAVRWNQPATPMEGESWRVQAGELQSVSTVGVSLWERPARWSRRSLQGELLGHRLIAFYSDTTRATWAPDGDFYVLHTGIEGREVVLQRLDTCGNVRWRRHVLADGARLFGDRLRADTDGNVCFEVSRVVPPPGHTPRNEVCDDRERRSHFVSAYGPDGAPRALDAESNREVSSWDGLFSAPFPYCPPLNSPRGVSVFARREVSALSAGRRLDVAELVPAVVRFVPRAMLPCAPGQHRCGGRCTDTASDVAHCAACGRGCLFAHGVGRCHGGSCVLMGCQDGFADCNVDPRDGCESDLRASRAHCGACDRPCGAGTCAQGRCLLGASDTAPFASDGHEGAFAPQRDVTLSAGVHQFTTIFIPEGVTVRTDGDGVLELRATGDVDIRGAVDLSGGDGVSPAIGLFPYGGNTGRPGASSARVNGPGGGGAGDVRSVAPTRGAGSGGGAPGRPDSGVACPYSSHSCEVEFRGGVAWGAPYDGFVPEETPWQCEMFRDVEGLSAVRRFRRGIPGGGASIGRAAAGDLGVFTTFGPGSGGGGGPGGGGGGGGGALRITSATVLMIRSTGRVRANGGAGGRNAGPGSGGVVYLAAPEVSVMTGAVVEAVAGGVATSPVTGLGRIRLSVNPAWCSLSGAFNPPLRAGCSPSPDGGIAGFTYVAPWPR